jgi:hypothetical protein
VKSISKSQNRHRAYFWKGWFDEDEDEDGNIKICQNQYQTFWRKTSTKGLQLTTNKKKHSLYQFFIFSGFNPVWNETFQFTVKCPELALVRFNVKDDGKVRADADLANFCIPFNSIQQGKQ